MDRVGLPRGNATGTGRPPEKIHEVEERQEKQKGCNSELLEKLRKCCFRVAAFRHGQAGLSLCPRESTGCPGNNCKYRLDLSKQSGCWAAIVTTNYVLASRASRYKSETPKRPQRGSGASQGPSLARARSDSVFESSRLPLHRSIRLELN